jgi:hypothetical protein
MIRFARWLGGAAALSLAIGCGGRRIADSSAGGSHDGTAGMSDAMGVSGATDVGDSNETKATGASGTSDDDATIPPLECPEGLTACPNSPECVNLWWDIGNCGECGHGCKGVSASGRCSNYQCEPGIWPCIPRGQGIVTCSEACASVGETCAPDAFCSGEVAVWLTDSAVDNNPEQNLEACLTRVSRFCVTRRQRRRECTAGGRLAAG